MVISPFHFIFFLRQIVAESSREIDFKLKSSKRSVAGAENDDSGLQAFLDGGILSTFYSGRQQAAGQSLGTESLRACVCPQKLCSCVRNTALGLVFMELEIRPISKR